MDDEVESQMNYAAAANVMMAGAVRRLVEFLEAAAAVEKAAGGYPTEAVVHPGMKVHLLSAQGKELEKMRTIRGE